MDGSGVLLCDHCPCETGTGTGTSTCNFDCTAFDVQPISHGALLTWGGASDCASLKVYKDGSFWTDLIAGTPQQTDSGQPGEIHTYYIEAYDESNNLICISETKQVTFGP